MRVIEATIIDDKEASTDVCASWKNLKKKLLLRDGLMKIVTYLTLKNTRGLMPQS